jgi:protocatechuate 3,4-dioxygenase beta subunit
LTSAIDATVTAPITPSQTIGPFFGFALPFAGQEQLVADDAPGAVRLEGQILDGDGEPVPDALIEIWQGDRFGRCRSDGEGVFHFVLARPDPPYYNAYVFARGLLRHLLTRIYFPDAEPDAVLASLAPDRRETVIAQPENGKLRFDIRLQGERETVFFSPA